MAEYTKEQLWRMKHYAPILFEACKDALNMLDAIDHIYPTPKTQAVLKEALAKVEDK